ncbi:MAG TPA: glycosyltransferase family 39 protein [bacterium]|nr:glycosyltransferase family 39 protein [bacterium]
MQRSSSTDNRSSTAKSTWVLVAIIGVAAGMLLAGIRKDLPHISEVDEEIFVNPALRIAATGDLNPHWFGNPGSTVIYPLALLFNVWNCVEHGGNFLRPDQQIMRSAKENSSEFFMLARLLTVLYALASIPFIFLIGRRLFGENVGLIGAWLSILSPLIIYYARLVRTDMAGLFFGAVAIWFYLKFIDRPCLKHSVLAGLATGLAIASRYFMATLIPLLVAFDILAIIRRRNDKQRLLALWRPIAVGLVALILGFALSSPYFFLDFETAKANLRSEDRSQHFGADGLSYTGNLTWYITTAIPRAITWPVALLAVAGAVLTIIRRRAEQLIVLGFVAVFILSASLSGLHWARWMIQILPLISILAADAVYSAALGLSAIFNLNRKQRAALTTVLILCISAMPLKNVLLMTLREASPSARVIAREWMLRNLPPGSKVANETYSAVLDNTDLVVQDNYTLAEVRSLRNYYDAGYRYLVVSSAIYGRYCSMPSRYPRQVRFYKELFQKGHLLKEFTPNPLRGGPTIRIYRLGEPSIKERLSRKASTDFADFTD